MSIVQFAIDDLKKHEGFRQFPYKDSLGILTIGYGRNLESNGISEREAANLLRGDVLEAIYGLQKRLEFWFELTEARQVILINMAVNMGIVRLMGFKKFLAALKGRNYQLAANEMLDSKWASQVGSRATELAQRMEHGF